MAVSEVGNLYYSDSLLASFRCSWTLKDFSTLDSTPGKEYRSRKLNVEDKENSVDFRLSIFPGGESVADKGFVSCFVRNFSKVQTSMNLMLDFSLQFLNAIGETICKFAVNQCTAANVALRSKQMIEKTDLVKKLTKDILVVFVEGTYSMSTIAINDITHNFHGVSPITQLVNDFKKMWSDGKNSDLVVCSGKVEFNVHSFVLGARSKVFTAMFEHKMSENMTRRVEINDFEPDIVKSLLRFMYCGTVENMNSSVAEELLRAADKYDMNDLKTHCSNYLVSRLNDENVVETLLIADLFGAVELKERAIERFCKRQFVFEEAKHREILVDRPQLLLDIVNRMKNL